MNPILDAGSPSAPAVVPVLPASAPFSVEQRAYLNGFLAGLFSRTPLQAHTETPRGPAGPTKALTVLFGSQTGSSEKLARRVARESARHGFAATVNDLATYPASRLPGESYVVLVTSTYGDGEPPDNARTFWQALRNDAAPRLASVRYALCALGDSNYAKFCGFGRDLDARLEALGAQRVVPRAECDVDYEATFAAWLAAALPGLAGADAGTPPRNAEVITATPEPAGTVPPPSPPAGSGRDHPFPATVLANRRLSGPGSAKEVRHYECSLAGCSVPYEAGDALGVIPENRPELVDELIGALGASGSELVPAPQHGTITLREALTHHYEIARMPRALVEKVAQATGDPELVRVASPDANGEWTAYQSGRDVVDLLRAHPGVQVALDEFIRLLRRLQPRLYSISSSPRAHPAEVHLTVGTVRFESHGRRRHGVCSTFLADRGLPGARVNVFVHANGGFRPPANDTPLIMIGPGTGIAPFRAFLEERRAVGSKGRNWLFFGDQTSAHDFLYRAELEDSLRSGVLTRLDLAWSRDQTSKVYVQDRMRQEGRELYRWLEDGAAIRVCGDASRMAKDVERALLDIVAREGGRTPEAAEAYLDQLKNDRRYQRDVY